MREEGQKRGEEKNVQRNTRGKTSRFFSISITTSFIKNPVFLFASSSFSKHVGCHLIISNILPLGVKEATDSPPFFPCHSPVFFADRRSFVILILFSLLSVSLNLKREVPCVSLSFISLSQVAILSAEIQKTFLTIEDR